MLFWIYWTLVLALCLMLGRGLLRDRDWRFQSTAALVLVPLLLRVLLVK